MLLTIASKRSASKAARFWSANSRAGSLEPPWKWIAPQQTCGCGTWTSQPFCCSTRAVAQLTWRNMASPMQPMKRRDRGAALADGGQEFRQRAFVALAAAAACRPSAAVARAAAA